MNSQILDQKDIINETKLELVKNECEDIGKVSGIYKIINVINNKIYIGSSKNIYCRKQQHIKCLNLNIHHNKHLQYSWNKYGKNVFKFVTIECCPLENLEIREQFWMDFYKCYDRKFGYNNDIKAFNREKSDETKEKLKIANTGKLHSLESRNKIRIFNLGRKMSTKTKLKMSVNNSRYWLNKKFPKETLKKLSISQTGKHNKDKNSAFDHKIYTFKHKISGEVFIGTRYDFYTKFCLSKSCICSLLKGNIMSHKKWIVIYDDNR